MVPGTLNNGCALFKLGLPGRYTAEISQLTEDELNARSRTLEIVDYLRRSDPLLAELTLSMIAPQVGLRSGPRSEGLQELNEAALIRCEKPLDGVAIGAWPIELWGEARQPTMRYFSIDDHYLIPAGALVSRHLKNLFFAGRGLSASEAAIASARVIGTCLSSGYAAGMLAVASLNEGDWQSAIETIRTQQVFTEQREA